MKQEIRNESIAARINFLQTKLGFANNRKFAEDIPFDTSQFSKIGKATLAVSLNLGLLLHDKYGVNLNWLFTGKGEWNDVPRGTSNSETLDPLVLENLQQLLSNQVESLGLIQQIQKRIKKEQNESPGIKSQDSVQDLIGTDRSAGKGKRSSKQS